MDTKNCAVQSPVLTDCKNSGWKRQSGPPTGIMGAAVLRLMAVKDFAMNKLAVETAHIEPQDQVLEVGFGHGRAIKMAAARTGSGKVCGIDVSEIMVKQAARSNKGYM